jgi:hypothetical protein
MNSKLTFEYEFSRDDDFGWLMARVETSDFSRSNGMWVQWQDIEDFAAALGRYPIAKDDAVECEWGFSERGQYIEVTKVRIAPSGSTGGIFADVSLADYYQPENRCQTRFETDYPSLSEFRVQIGRMMQTRTGSATLNGFKASVS